MASSLLKLSDVTANDSNKTFTVPAGYTYEILYGQVDYTSTATVGNRQILLEILDTDSNVIWDVHAGTVQAASLNRHYSILQGVFRETAFVDGDIQLTIPRKGKILPGYTIKVYDSAEVDATADDMNVHLVVEKVKI